MAVDKKGKIKLLYPKLVVVGQDKSGKNIKKRVMNEEEEKALLGVKEPEKKELEKKEETKTTPAWGTK